MAAEVSGEIEYVKQDGTLTYEGIALLQDIIAGSGGGGGVSDGDKGDITVSGAGTVWTIDATIPASLDDLSDVIITAPALDEVLVYNGSEWVNAPATAGGDPLVGWFL